MQDEEAELIAGLVPPLDQEATTAVRSRPIVLLLRSGNATVNEVGVRRSGNNRESAPVGRKENAHKKPKDLNCYWMADSQPSVRVVANRTLLIHGPQRGQGGYPMSTEQNKAVVRRFIEQILNTGDTALVDELFAPDYVNHLVPGGREGFKQFWSMLRSAYPDFKWDFTVERLIAEGDYVTVRATMHATNAGKEATGSGLAEFRLAEGRIVEDWPISEVANLMQQVGMTLPSA
jgi:predicted SnoaL-like aldol condensation-catalyzing enzyme